MLVGLVAAGLLGTLAATARERPLVAGFSLSPPSFAVGSPGAGGGTTVRFRLSRAATVAVAIARRQPGRVIGGRCVKPTRRLAHRRSCARYVGAGRLIRARERAGRHAVRFSGRIHGHPLSCGRYRARLTATATDSHRSGQRSTAFTVICRRGAAPTNPSAFPNPSNTGVPAGWAPAQIRDTDLTVTTPGAVVHDIELDNADLMLLAPNITVRRVRVRGGRILNASGNTCAGRGAVIEDSTIEPPPGLAEPQTEPYVVGEGGYTLRRVKIWRAGDGPRVSYFPEGCGPVHIEDSYINVFTPVGDCDRPGFDGWHTDGLQGWYGAGLTVRDSTFDAGDGSGCNPSRAFFYPDQQNNHGPVVIDHVLASGGAVTWDLTQGPATVKGLRLVDRTWTYYPITTPCSVTAAWEAKIVKIDNRSDFRVTRIVRNQPCI